METNQQLFKDKIGIPFDQFYNDTYNMAVNYFNSKFSGNNFYIDIDGYINDGFIRLLNRMDNYDETKGHVKTYLFTIIYNLILAHIKRKRVDIEYHEEIYDSTYFKNYEEEVDDAIHQNNKRKLKEYIEGLNDKGQEIFALRLTGMPINKISEIVNVNMNTVKLVLYTNATKKLNRKKKK